LKLDTKHRAVSLRQQRFLVRRTYHATFAFVVADLRSPRRDMQEKKYFVRTRYFFSCTSRTDLSDGRLCQHLLISTPTVLVRFSRNLAPMVEAYSMCIVPIAKNCLTNFQNSWRMFEISYLDLCSSSSSEAV